MTGVQTCALPICPDKTIFCGTRYGNVMASRGSVIPLFIKQAREGKTITVTDPNMTRFLMSLNDSVNLVLYAFNNGDQGDIFVQKAPASTIMDLAIAIKELVNTESEIKVIGTRHGEKLYETLLTREELSKAEDCSDYYKIMSDDRDLNYSKYFTEGEEQISQTKDYNSHNTRRLNVEEVKEKLMAEGCLKEEISV